jgi:hypothetical protein
MLLLIKRYCCKWGFILLSDASVGVSKRMRRYARDGADYVERTMTASSTADMLESEEALRTRIIFAREELQARNASFFSLSLSSLSLSSLSLSISLSRFHSCHLFRIYIYIYI